MRRLPPWSKMRKSPNAGMTANARRLCFGPRLTGRRTFLVLAFRAFMERGPVDRSAAGSRTRQHQGCGRRDDEDRGAARPPPRQARRPPRRRGGRPPRERVRMRIRAAPPPPPHSRRGGSWRVTMADAGRPDAASAHPRRIRAAAPPPPHLRRGARSRRGGSVGGAGGEVPASVLRRPKHV